MTERPRSDATPPVGAGGQLWLELPPISASAPRRLLVFLHAAGSSPDLLAPAAIAFQLKFPGATAAILHGLRDSAAGEQRLDWFDPAGPDRTARADAAADTVALRVDALQKASGVSSRDTALIGFSQGASVALEIARRHPEAASIVLAYAARLVRPMRDGERPNATIHLIHGEYDSIVPLAHAQAAYRGLVAAGADVSLDIAAGLAHGIDQDMVNLGTWRLMRTLFRGRSRGSRSTVH